MSIPASDESSTAALAQAVALAGSQSALARLLGVSQNAVSKWLREKRLLPAEHVLRVEAETGVSRHDLRADLYPNEPNDEVIATDPNIGRMEPTR